MPDLRSIIDTERDRQGLTVYALANRARVSERALGLYLRGERECRSDVLVRIFAALSLSVCARKTPGTPKRAGGE